MKILTQFFKKSLSKDTVTTTIAEVHCELLVVKEILMSACFVSISSNMYHTLLNKRT